MSKKLDPVLGRQMAKVCLLLGFCSMAGYFGHRVAKELGMCNAAGSDCITCRL
jgi:hypothetical protein